MIQKIEEIYELFYSLLLKQKQYCSLFNKVILLLIESKYGNNINYNIQHLINIIYSCELLKYKIKYCNIFLSFITNINDIELYNFIYFRNCLKINQNINYNKITSKNLDFNKIIILKDSIISAINQCFSYDNNLINIITQNISNNNRLTYIEILEYIYSQININNNLLKINDAIIKNNNNINDKYDDIIIDKKRNSITYNKKEYIKDIDNNTSIEINKILLQKIKNLVISLNKNQEYYDFLNNIIFKKLKNIIIAINSKNYNKFCEIIRANYKDKDIFSKYNFLLSFHNNKNDYNAMIDNIISDPMIYRFILELVDYINII